MKNKWILLALLCAIFVTYTVDRALLGLLAVPIQKDLGLTDVQFGFVSAAIFWTFSVCVPFSGLAGDQFDRRKLIGLAAVTWSAMAVLAGFSSGFWSLFFLASVALVAPQTMYGPSANALLAECHVDTRTIALSCHQAAYYTGWFVSGAAVAGILALFGSWRAAFVVFGTVGVLLGLVFLGLNRRQKMPDDAKQAVRQADKPTVRQSILAFFGCKTAVLVSVCYVVLAFIGFGYASWGPKFIAQKFALTPSAAGTGVMFSYNAAAFGAILVTGFVTDRLVKRFPRFRLALSAAAVLLQIPALVAFALAPSLPLVWTAAAFLGAMMGVVGANQFTMIFDVVPSQYRAGSIGFLNVIAGLVGSTAPIILGTLSQRFGVRGFELGFAGFGAVELLAVLALLVAMTLTFKADIGKVMGKTMILAVAFTANVLTASGGSLDEKLILATEQATGAIEIFAARPEPGTNVVWRWTAKDDPNVREQDKGLFGCPDECKGVDGGRLILVTASGGGFAGIDVAAGRCAFYGKAGGNPHSVERLPDGRIAVASSTGRTLKIFDVAKHPLDPERQPSNLALDLPGGHGLVWDASRQSLFALGYTNIFECAYVPETLSVRVKHQWNYTSACGDPWGHDFLSDGKGGFLFTNGSGVWAFDPDAGTFRLARGIPNVKSFSPSSDGDLLSVPRERWWTDTLLVVKSHDGAVADVREIKVPKARFYKARWFEKTPTSPSDCVLF